MKIEIGLRTNESLRIQMQQVIRWERDFLDDSPKDNPDTNLLGHTKNTASNTIEMTADDQIAGRLSSAEIPLLTIAAYIHDLGELGSGDVTRRRKTAEDKIAERNHFHQHLSEWFPELTEEEAILVRKIYDDIAWGMETGKQSPVAHLAEYFRMIEVTGYVAFAVESFRDKPEDLDWDRVAQGILHFQGPEIDDAIDTSNGLVRFWQRRAPDLKEMIEHYRRKDSEELRYPIDFTKWDRLLAQLPD